MTTKSKTSTKKSTKVVVKAVKVLAPEKSRNMIFEYIKRRKSGKTFRVGVIVGESIDNEIRIGWSKCNFAAGDKFDATAGLARATERAYGVAPLTPTPLCIQSQVRSFGARCVRYFKGANVVFMPV